MLSAPRPRAWAAFPRAVALGRETGECVERSRCAPQGEMASYVDNSFRQAVMKNPAERTPQVSRAATRLGLVSADCALPGPRHCWAGETARSPIQDFPCPNFQGHSFQTALRLLPSPLLSFTLRSLGLTLPMGLRGRSAVSRAGFSRVLLSRASESWDPVLPPRLARYSCRPDCRLSYSLASLPSLEFRGVS